MVSISILAYKVPNEFFSVILALCFIKFGKKLSESIVCKIGQVRRL